MIFNSIEFAFFLPIVFFLYWFIFNRFTITVRNAFLLCVSYIFYGWWDPRFLLLIIISSATDYAVGLLLERSRKKIHKNILLGTSITINLGILGFFKYYNFFVDSFVDTFSLFGNALNISTLSIVLPVGISFYTFQTMGYAIDIYRGTISPTKNMLAFFSFVTFFPQLVAGPIERSANLLPQFLSKRTFNYVQAKDGAKQILWGLFKKIAVADTLAPFVTTIFDSPETMSSAVLITGAIFFTIQLYADFSGYSDIAIGTAKLFGFKLMTNFAYPLFARDIAEFWRKWHISLTTWFIDYVYIPLGGSRVGITKKIRNVFVIFVLSGFWHGASLSFIVWGLINAIYFLPLMLRNKNRIYKEPIDESRMVPRFSELINILKTFLLFAFSLIFFRTETLGDAMIYIQGIIFNSGSFPVEYFYTIHLIVILFVFEWLHKSKDHPLQLVTKNKVLKCATYFFIFYITVAHLSNVGNEFIYFQF